MNKRTYKLAGDIFMAPVDAAGTLIGNFVKAGNLHPLTITVNIASEDMLSAGRDTAGQVLESQSRVEGIEAEATMRQWGLDELAYSLAATVEDMTGTGGTVAPASGSTLTAPPADEWIEVGQQNISALVLTEDTDTDPAVYVLGTDYLADEQLGMITIIAGGAITAADPLRYGYDYAADTGKRLNIGKSASTFVALRGSLVNLNTGETLTLDLYKVSVSASGGMTVISDPGTTYEELPLKLKLLTPPGGDKPGTLDGVAL